MSLQPFLGIDFGTCNSSMAWFNPKTGQAEALLNAEGEDKTPSIVYFGSPEILVGRPAEDMLESAEERRQVLSAVKRELAKPRVWMKSGRRVTPVDAAVEILKKLKLDAEEGHFHEPVPRAVITYPADFDETEKEKLQEAARKAGFREVVLLAEPVAAAIAYTEAGVEVGRHVLVYDLGGGTFDLAFLKREDGEEAFRLALQPQGERIGGEDFDRAIYGYFEDAIRKQVGQPFCPDGVDLHLLRQCRRYKENLSLREQPVPFSWIWPGKGRVKNLKISREKFEELIGEHVGRTIRLTQSIRDEAVAMGYEVSSVILIGGSTRIPLVGQQLRKTLSVQPLKWGKQDIAVALGAAYYANQKWGKKRSDAQKVSTPDPSINGPADQYRRAVKWVWRDQVMGRQELEQLFLLAQQLGLSREEAGVIELEVIGDFKETAFDRQRNDKSQQNALREKRHRTDDDTQRSDTADDSQQSDIEAIGIVCAGSSLGLVIGLIPGALFGGLGGAIFGAVIGIILGGLIGSIVAGIFSDTTQQDTAQQSWNAPQKVVHVL